MNFLCCLPNCPLLLSDDDSHQGSNLIFEQKLSSYIERFGFSYYKTDVSFRKILFDI